ncbi:STAS domain-containing protein [Prauserella cavernicola]|uniref:STAS domain-containing protein n=1 Tax=Prauserella cavernicola TaxID=2800127 RepID=A0A934QWD2_9PSEU|nr:STAS domain-containing protein [Prauserella cavernicola]MBK1787746.1 STAS domain-containing protein [Prauserella cavernicola]
MKQIPRRSSLGPPRDPGLLSVTITSSGNGCLLATVVGELDAATAPALDAEIRALPDETTSALVLDLTRVGFCAAAGVSTLLDLLELTNSRGAPLALVADSAPVLRPLAILGLAGHFPTFTSRAAALASVGAAPASS